MSTRRPLLRALLAALALAWLVPVALAADRPALSGVVNVNTASLEELELLPGVGRSRAEAIVAERKQRGGFQAVDELVEVRGIGPALLDKLRAHVVLKGKTTARRL